MSALAEKIHNLPPFPGVYLFKDARGRRCCMSARPRAWPSAPGSYLAGDLARAPPARADGAGRRPRHHRHRHRGRGAAARVLADPAAPPALQRPAQGRQELPLRQDQRAGGVPAPVDHAGRSATTARATWARTPTSSGCGARCARSAASSRCAPAATSRTTGAPNRPCLYFHIRRCVGPCTTRGRRSAPPEYRALVDGLLLFLTGRDDELLRRLRGEMAAGVRGARVRARGTARDQIALLERARVPQKMVRAARATPTCSGWRATATAPRWRLLVLRGGRVVGKESAHRSSAPAALEDADAAAPRCCRSTTSRRRELPRRIVVGGRAGGRATLTARGAGAARRRARSSCTVPQRGRDRRLLRDGRAQRGARARATSRRAQAGRRARFSPTMLELQRELGLPAPPHRMVCFDISNLGPDHAVAAVVASENGRPRRSLYRRMRIRRPGPDDLGAPLSLPGLAPLAQSAEHFHGKEGVYGSSP